MRGRIIRSISGFYDMKTEDGSEYRVRGAGKLRKNEIVPLVGDFAIFEKDGFLTEIEPRKNFLIRPKVSNIDQVVIVVSLWQPDFSSILLNKMLAVVESRRIKPIIVFTKTDLNNEKPWKEYISNGYCVYNINNESIDLEVLEKIREDMNGKISVFMGQTGAGKSTTINNIASLNLKTGETSKALGRGKHTTRVVEILDWFEGGLIDTPGFSSFDLELTQSELSKSYADFLDASENCEFKNCIHNFEKKCEVKKRVSEEKISEQRYKDYLRLLGEIENERK